MEIILIIVWILLILLWILGCFLPILPWPLFAYIAFIILQMWPWNPFEVKFLIIRFAIIVIVTILDYFIPIIWTKKMWGTKRWSRGATIWLIVSIIILPILSISIGPFWLIWIIWLPFVGTRIWERIHGKANALKAAFWSFLWFLTGTLLKLVVTIIIAWYFIKASRETIGNLFW